MRTYHHKSFDSNKIFRNVDRLLMSILCFYNYFPECLRDIDPDRNQNQVHTGTLICNWDKQIICPIYSKCLLYLQMKNFLWFWMRNKSASTDHIVDFINYLLRAAFEYFIVIYCDILLFHHHDIDVVVDGSGSDSDSGSLSIYPHQRERLSFNCCSFCFFFMILWQAMSMSYSLNGTVFFNISKCNKLIHRPSFTEQCWWILFRFRHICKTDVNICHFFFSYWRIYDIISGQFSGE